VPSAPPASDKPEARARSRRVTGKQFALGLFTLASAIGLLLFVDRYLTRVTAGRTDDWVRVLVEQLSGAYVAALLIPLMVYGTRRLPPFGSGWVLHLPMHFAIALGVGMLHTTLTNLSRIALIELTGLGLGDYDLHTNRFLLAMPNQLIVYAVVVGITLVVDRYRAARNRELEAAELKSRLTRAQLEALRRQLEPHFLTTTLNTVSELVYTSPKAAEEMIARLTALLRHAFAPDQEHETVLGEELRTLDLYLDMMRLRFAERLFVQIDAPAELHPMRVPRTLLQPLMENALKCSAEPNQSLVAVRVTVRREGDDLMIRVRDRGPGCSASARSVGLANITARIQTLYGSDYGISLKEADEGGAEVQVKLPARLRETA
jgi:two-component system LytT family sensor kinase